MALQLSWSGCNQGYSRTGFGTRSDREREREREKDKDKDKDKE
jgi:hypothetical protein